MRTDETSRQIPVLDLRRFDAGEAERAAFLVELREAAHEVGFFYVTGHGVDAPLLSDLMDMSAGFFSLPERDKLAIEMVNSPHFRGYNRVASELTRGRPDWREQLDIGAERQALPPSRGAPAWTRLRGPNQWPAALPGLRPVVLRWQTAAMQVLIRLLRAFALALGQRVDAHKDTDMITLLLQDDHGGLQVETPQGWVDVPPRTGSIASSARRPAYNGYRPRFSWERVSTPSYPYCHWRRRSPRAPGDRNRIRATRSSAKWD
jgi:isopenicillin N synthase-like dioxygenase